MQPLHPAAFQPALPNDLILDEPPDEDAVPLDVLFVGGGPAGLAGAIRLAQLAEQDRESGGPLADLEIGVLEKSGELGEHCLSGAIVNPEVFKTLFPDTPTADLPFRDPVRRDRVYYLTERGKIRLPTPPTMQNHGNYVGSICEIVKWLGERAEELGVNIFTGFPADALLRQDGKIVGVRTTPAGLDRDGNPAAGFMPPTDLSARVTVLAEGTRGLLAQAWLADVGIESDNPPIFALGVKELWQGCGKLDAVTHTLGWPLPGAAFGGSFIYPMADDLIALGLVVGLDAPFADLDVHAWLQAFKRHPFVSSLLDGGEIVEWGAKTIPEGGFHAIPKRLTGDGVILVGDAAGLVDVAALKGIHYAMRSGVFSAEAIGRALEKDDPSAAALATYETSLRASFEGDAIHRNRNMRLAFKSGFVSGGMKASMMQLTGGGFPGRRIASETDADEPRTKRLGVDPGYDTPHAMAKADAVFYSGNSTRDDIPSHLIVGKDVSPELADLYASLCPAGVYEREGDRLIINAPNCIDCKATDVIGPRWTPREGGSGPTYKRM